MCENEEGKDMELVVDVEKNEKLTVKSQKFKSKVPHLEVVNGKVQINDTDPLQKKWFEEFKK
jgi:hypothetical protein